MFFILFRKQLYMKTKQAKKAKAVLFRQLNNELSLSPHINFKQVDMVRIKPDEYTFFLIKKFCFIACYSGTNLW